MKKSLSDKKEKKDEGEKTPATEELKTEEPKTEEPKVGDEETK